MPLPFPETGETKNEFISRCIKELNETEKERFPHPKQITAICFSRWKEYKKENSTKKDIKAMLGETSDKEIENE